MFLLPTFAHTVRSLSSCLFASCRFVLLSALSIPCLVPICSLISLPSCISRALVCPTISLSAPNQPSLCRSIRPVWRPTPIAFLMRQQRRLFTPFSASRSVLSLVSPAICTWVPGYRYVGGWGWWAGGRAGGDDSIQCQTFARGRSDSSLRVQPGSQRQRKRGGARECAASPPSRGGCRRGAACGGGRPVCWRPCDTTVGPAWARGGDGAQPGTARLRPRGGAALTDHCQWVRPRLASV